MSGTNIYTKLMAVRLGLAEMGLKKTGKNKHQGYSYFELSDFVPQATRLFSGAGLCPVCSFGADFATMTIYDMEAPESTITVTSPMATAELKGNHAIQNLGAVETYQRRYLYLAVLDMCQTDAYDSGQIDSKTEPARTAPPKAQTVPTPAAARPPARQQKPAGASQPRKDAENGIIINPDEGISEARVRFIRAILSERGINPDHWKEQLNIAHISEISWKCLDDWKDKATGEIKREGLVAKIKAGDFDHLADKSEQQALPIRNDEDIDLDDDDPFREGL